MIDQHSNLLSEQMRPKKLTDLMLKQSYIERFQRMVESKSIMNMLFYGRAGTGKTSTARILLKAIDAEVYPLNGSHNYGDKKMVNDIDEFSSTVSLWSQPKVVFIDEADGLSQSVQASLRFLIENHSERVRFILTANDEKKLSDAIKSRCAPLCFDPPRGSVNDIVDRLTARYTDVLLQLGVQSDAQRVRDIISPIYPDMRAIANALDLEYL